MRNALPATAVEGASAWRAFQSVPERFAWVAERHPENVALASSLEAVDYASAVQRVDRLARRLVAGGVRPGDRVAVAMERAPEMYLLFLAILRAGGAFVPLDPSYPRARLEQMIALAAPRLIVSSLQDIPAVESPDVLPVARRDDPAYVMFTSGSTGTPKGVVVPHRGILRLVIDPNYVQLGSDEVIPQLSPTAFDASTFEIWGALLNGGTLVVPPPGKFSVGELGAFLDASRATTAFFTTGFFHVIIDEKPAILAGLRQALAGGDVLSAAHVRRLATVAPALRIINGYGPTEATTFALCYTAPAAGEVPDPLPIGLPVNATDVLILDSKGAAAAEGEAGELYLGGDGVALGYIGNDGETAARFLPDPRDGRSGVRLYRTGDLVRRDRDGFFRFLGRADQQVKIRGFRIEPGEIEARLREHPDVRDAVVIARPVASAATDRTLAAYVVLRERGAENWAEILRRHLLAALPAFMVPSDWTALENFPLGPTGKVDRQALPALSARAPGGPASAVAERPDTVGLVCRVAGEILGGRGPGAEDNFMDSGGDSLSAARLAVRLEAATGVPLPLGQILAAATFAEIAAQLDRGRGQPRAAIVPPCASPLHRREFPLSLEQEQLWLVHGANPQSPAYNEPCLITLPQALAPAVIEAALARLVERHPMLRTTYGLKDGVPCQHIGDPARCPFAVVPGDDFAAHAAAVIAGAFDLRHGPLMRACYAPCADGSAQLLLVTHHIAFDGVSLFETLLPELQRLCLEPGVALPPPALRYGDFAEWQRREFAPEKMTGALGYWADRLAGVEPLALPFRAAPPQGCTLALVIPPALAEGIRTLAKRERVTPFAVTAMALVALLRRYTQQDDLLIGFLRASRPFAVLDGVVGGFVNTLALRTRLAARTSLRDLLQQVWTAIREAQDHDAPFEAVAAAAAQRMNLRGRALLDVLISYDPPAPPLAHGWKADHLAFPKSEPKFPLSVELGDAPDGSIRGRIEHNAAFLPPAAAARLAGHFQAILAAAVKDATVLVEAVDFLAPAEWRRLTGDWQPRDVAGAGHEVIGDMLDHAALTRPGREALVFGPRRLTYTALRDAAREKAAGLRALGLGPGRPAALLFRDPFQRCLAAWSVWLAGGVVVPLDPEYPEERLGGCLAQIPSVLVLNEEVFAGPGAGDGPFAPVRRSPDDLAYIIFTSGSTGRPKGAMISHRNACAMVQAHIEAAGTDEDLRTLQMAGPGFDAFVSELLFTCARGGTLVVAERRSLLPGRELAEVIARERINDALFTPTLLAYVSPADFPTLTTITCAGEHCPPEQATRWIAAGVRFIHAYGPAECTVCATLAVIDQPRHDFLPLGQPLPGYRLYLLDPWGNLVPPGVVGEICLGGTGVGLGYLDAAATAERFGPDRFSQRADARLYRTGDLGRFNEAGELEFMGRNDFQIKIRGQRIETGEIETILLEQAGAVAAIILPVGRGADISLGAIVEWPAAPAPGWRLALARLLRERLPAHMVPSHFVWVERMPMNANGKVDRRRLPAFTEEDRAVAATAAGVALSPAERAIWDVWREVFPRVPEEASVDFFELGGHSLLAARLVTCFNERFSTAMPMKELFARPTIAGMADWLHQADGTRPAAADPAADARGALGLPAIHPRSAADRILLTGASGFVGSHLLWQLLDGTRAEIHCLVRGHDGRERVRRALAAAGHQAPDWARRLHFTPGDLASPDLLAPLGRQEFGAIYHCGALVNSVYPYSATRGANVDGVKRLLGFAAACGAVFNHISTVGVFEGGRRERSGPIGEDEAPGAPPPEESGYNCSKWVSEMLVRRAGEAGLPTRIFRLGRAAWSGRTGAWNDNDFLCRLLRGCRQLGAAPDWGLDFQVIPVDFLAQAVAGLAAASPPGGTYHLVGRTHLRWPALCAELRRRDPALQVLAHDRWWRELVAAGEDNALAPLVDKLSPASGIAAAVAPDFATDGTARLLAHLGLDESAVKLERCRLEP